MEDGEKVEDGRDERVSAIGDGGQAAISLMPNADEHMFVSLRVCNLMVCM